MTRRAGEAPFPTPLECRILGYLEQQGGRKHRTYMVQDFSGPEAKWNRGGGGGSNGAAPLIAGAWCKRLVAAGWVQAVHDWRGVYVEHTITQAGREGLRALPEAPAAG